MDLGMISHNIFQIVALRRLFTHDSITGELMIVQYVPASREGRTR